MAIDDGNFAVHVARQIARQIAAKITEAALGEMVHRLLNTVTSMDNAAASRSRHRDSKTFQKAMAAYRTVAQRGATAAARVHPIGAGKTFVWRDEPLIKADGSERNEFHRIEA